jgi:tartrate dehydratase beta subunit/fumarate hydratase class I family protein
MTPTNQTPASAAVKKTKPTDLIRPSGKVYTYDDISHLNETQKAHRRGELDVYAGSPSIADMWKREAQR